jgi:hypothetical protein
MKINKIIAMRMLFCIMVLLMTTACRKSESNEVNNNGTKGSGLARTKIEKAPSEDKNTIIAGNDTEDVKTMEKFTPEYDGCLFPVDFERLGLKDMVSLSEVTGKVPEEILLRTTKININIPSVKNFHGIERFVNLQYLELFNLELNDLTEISLHIPLEWLTISNSVIKNMIGLSNLQKLYLFLL